MAFPKKDNDDDDSSSSCQQDLQHEESLPTKTTNPHYSEAAMALQKADYLLILAGAGMSADSGLKTYENMPEEYRELCDPVKLTRDHVQQTEFWDFWYNFAVVYASTTPHDGYGILDNWCHGGKLKRLSSSTKLSSSCSLDQKWWVYTSNVDGHFARFPSFRNNICEIHGFAGVFKCSSSIGYFGPQKEPRMGDVWTNWNRIASRVETSKCSSNEESLEALQRKQGPVRRKCVECQELCLRPKVLLFNDTDESILRGISQQRVLYQDWEASVEEEVSQKGKNLVLLEIGCGLKVPAIRRESQEVLRDTMELMTLMGRSPSSGSVTLIRINPTDAGMDKEEEGGGTISETNMKANVISIYEKALPALQTLDRDLDRLLGCTDL